MSKVVLYLFSIFILFAGCSLEEEYRIDELNKEIEALENKKSKEDSAINYYVTYTNSLHDNIDRITSKQTDLLERIKHDPSLLTDGESSIKEEIASIGKMIEENNTEIKNFKTSYSNSELESDGISQLINHSKENLEEKHESITDLQSQLEAVDVAFDDLFSVFGETLAELDETKNSLTQTKKYLNTVWYVIDTKKILVEKEIITIEGGFIGIGKNEALKSNFNIKHFTRGNKNTLRKIALSKNSKKHEFVTSHPKDSYQITGNTLEILNTNDFWSISKYLVI